MQPGDFVKMGIILSTGYNMWGEEIEGQETGVKVLWQDGDSYIVSTDELEVISEAG